MPKPTQVPYDEVVAGLTEPVIVNGTAHATLPFNLQPAPARPADYRIVDLGDYDPAWAGFKAVFDMDLPIEIEELAVKASDDGRSRVERIEAQYQFLEAALIAWNFTVEGVLGRPELLPQPREGGVRKLRLSQVKTLMLAFGKVYNPNQN